MELTRHRRKNTCAVKIERMIRTSRATGTDSGIMNSRAVAAEGGKFAATINVEGECIIFSAAVPIKDGECSAGGVVKC